MKNEFEENLESLELQYAGDINYMCENYGILVLVGIQIVSQKVVP